MLTSIVTTTFVSAVAGAMTFSRSQAGYINYTAVTGYFLQDDPATNASTFNYV
jgi:hypothetical protein